MVFLSRIFNTRRTVTNKEQKEVLPSEIFVINANLFIKNFKETLSERSKKHNWDYKDGSVSFDFTHKVFSYFNEVVFKNEKIIIDMIEAFDEVIVKFELPFAVVDFDDEHIIIGLKA